MESPNDQGCSSKVMGFFGQAQGNKIFLTVWLVPENPDPSLGQHLQNLERWVRIEIGGVGAVPDLSSVGNISK